MVLADRLQFSYATIITGRIAVLPGRPSVRPSVLYGLSVRKQKGKKKTKLVSTLPKARVIGVSFSGSKG